MAGRRGRGLTRVRPDSRSATRTSGVTAITWWGGLPTMSRPLCPWWSTLDGIRPAGSSRGATGARKRRDHRSDMAGPRHHIPSRHRRPGRAVQGEESHVRVC